MIHGLPTGDPGFERNPRGAPHRILCHPVPATQLRTGIMAIETITYGFGETKLGDILVAASSAGLVAILIGDDRGRLRRELGETLPDTVLVEDRAGLAGRIAAVERLVDMPNAAFDLPLDLRGSDLERAVWAALTRIPSGETTTYGALARSLPVMATAQEVGAACAANRLAVAIPCHRVVKADGSISGYRWGVQRKRRLINLKGVA
jgi:AraC family transcriptional regulator of adaptative response/methylated-DNA-[protein]-cysteine methyltransferase